MKTHARELVRSLFTRVTREYVAEKYNAFFTGSASSTFEEGDAIDPVLSVIQQHPMEAVWFIKAVMLFGTLTSLVVCGPCVIFLYFHWEPCGKCNRPLRCWILTHCILLMLQAPVRVVFYFRLVRSPVAAIANEIKSLATSPAWSLSKLVSVVSYGWFILGIVWLLNSSHCDECPMIYRLTLAVICMSLSRLIITLGCFYRSFPPQDLDIPFRSMPDGACQIDIEKIKVDQIDVKSDFFGEPCAICLSHFDLGDLARLLPCNHAFHRPCIDKWLRRHRVCPLCMKDIKDKVA